MLRLIAHRLLLSIPLLLIVSIIVFVLQSLIPGDAARQLLGFNATPEAVAALREQMGLDRPLHEQYLSWLNDALHGSLGNSMASHQPVVEQLGHRLPVTLSLVIGSTLIAVVVGVLLGVASSRGKALLGRSVDVLSILGMAIPSFWVALVLVTFFSISLGWLPATGYVPLSESPSRWLLALVLPLTALSLPAITAIAKQARESMLDVGASEHVRILRLNGIPERSIVYKHVLRGSAIRITTVAGLQFVAALGGSVVIEQVFGLPGLGSLAVAATATKDISVIQGVTLYFTLLVIAVNLITDIAYGWLNPRVRTA